MPEGIALSRRKHDCYKDEERYVIIGWNWQEGNSGRGQTISYRFSLPSIGEQAIMINKKVDPNNANPLRTWSNLGKPRILNPKELAIYRQRRNQYKWIVAYRKRWIIYNGYRYFTQSAVHD